MALFKFSFRKKTNPPAAPAAPLVQRPKTLAELEQEINAGQPVLKTYRMDPSSGRRKSGLGGKLLFFFLLVGVPATALWVMNLPYAPIRRPIARNAPVLLLPSYMNVDQNFREAIALVEQSTQLIDNATSFADIEMGAQKVVEAQAKLDALPLDLTSYWPDRYYWYSWRFSPIAFNGARAEIGRLQAKVFQEQNANTVLTDAEQALTQAKQDYQFASDDMAKQAAITAWRVALSQLEMVPAQTLAGDIARQRLQPEQDEFQTLVGLSAANQESAAIIAAARAFGMQAAVLGKNPPHPVYHWVEIERLWAEAIAELGRISPVDPNYAEAQKVAADYRSNLAQIRIRRQDEDVAVRAFDNANQEISRLTADGSLDSYEVSRLQEVIRTLESIPNGTSTYRNAGFLRIRALNMLDELQR